MACGLLLTARLALFWDITHRGEASYIAEEDKTSLLYRAIVNIILK